MTAPANDRGRLASCLLFLLLVVLAYANPLFLRRNFAGRDLAVYNLPMEKAMHDAYARGRLPVWMNEISGGRPLMPNPNAGALYPVRPLLSVLPFPVAMRLFPVVHWIAAGIGMILLLRSLGSSAGGAWIGAVTYVFSGIGVSEVYFPNLHPGMALLPWIVWAVARPALRAGTKLVLLSILFALDFLAGDVFTIGIAIVSSILWISLEKPSAHRIREIAVLAGALGLAALFAAPQILATALWVPETNRAVIGMQLRESLFFSVHPMRLVELAVPFPYGALWQLDDTSIWGWPIFHYKGMGMFLTLYVGAFALVALVVTLRAHAPGLRFGRGLILLALLVAVPPSLLPKAWEKASSPLPLRNPEKFSVALVFALAVIAGIALDRLREDRRRPRWPLAIAMALTAFALAARVAPQQAGRAAVTVSGDDRWLAIASRELPKALAEGAFLWTLTFLALDRLARPKRPALYAAVALLTLVPLLANRKIARTLTEEELFSPSPFARRLQRWDPTDSYRTLGESLYSRRSSLDEYPEDVHNESGRRSWFQHAQALWGRGTVFNNDFDVGDLSRVQSLRRLSVVAAGYADSRAFFGSYALRWGLRFRDQKPIAGYRPIGGDALQYWDLLESAEPDVRLARRWTEQSDAMAALAVLPRVKEGEVVLETGRTSAGSARAGIVHALRKEPERLVVETVSADPGWLFVLRGFWSYRSVTIDGRAADWVPAQLAYSAIPVPSGRHRIEWRERVPGGELSRWGPVLGLLVAAGALARSWRSPESA